MEEMAGEIFLDLLWNRSCYGRMASISWHAVGFAEIDKAASRVLTHHYGSNMPGEPLCTNGIPNHGDFTKIDVSTLGPVDVLIGGTPCQTFSIAGKGLSMADARGNLTLAYAVFAHEMVLETGFEPIYPHSQCGALTRLSYSSMVSREGFKPPNHLRNRVTAGRNTTVVAAYPLKIVATPEHQYRKRRMVRAVRFELTISSFQAKRGRPNSPTP